ncbi:MAG: DUF2284 domain-containing protein [Methanobrevibacter smithii]|jgi:predicted metal-binding protein|nr:DUF2284 domain-containing protein [Methanobrevibacter smithii]
MVSISKLTADVDVSEYYDKYVDIEKFLEICKECDQYGNNWGCPPFDFDPNEIWNSFNKLKIIAFKFDFSKEELNQTYAPNELDFIIKRLERMKVKLMNEIYALENEDSLGLFMGNCNLCMRCTKTIGMPCKMPFKLRYSIESLGGDVDKTVEDTFGYKIIYAKDGKLPEYMIFVGGLLYDKK